MTAYADPKFWNKIAPGYAAQPVGDQQAFERKIAVVLELLRPDGVVLNVGCGTGSLAMQLAARCAEVHGLDVSDEMVRIAREKAVEHGVGNAHFHVGPFDESFELFGEAEVDLVNAFSILHLLEDRPAGLRQIFGLLKPGGRFVSSTVCLGGTWVPYGLIIGAMGLVGKAPGVGIVSHDELLAEMHAAGFTDAALVDVGATDSKVAFVVASKPA